MYYCSWMILLILMKRLKYLLWLFFFLPVFVKATGDPIVINSLHAPIRLKSNLSIFEDTVGDAVIEKLLKRPDLFVPAHTFLPKRKNHIFWVRTDIVVSVPTEAALL